MSLIKIGSHSFGTLVALTEEEKKFGLMHRSWPPPILCFPFKRASIRKFHMKNTPSPLDLIFCCYGQVIDILQGEPFSLEQIGPNKPTDLVIEMPQGMAKAANISLGQEVELEYSPEAIIRLYL